MYTTLWLRQPHSERNHSVVYLWAVRNPCGATNTQGHGQPTKEVDMADYKRCSVCGQQLPATPEFFHRSKATSSGLCGTCKECAKQRSRQWHADHKAEASARARRYYAEHRDSLKANARKYYGSNQETKKQYSRQYYADNRETIVEQRKDYRRRTKAESEQRVRDWCAANPERRRAIANRYGKTDKGHVARLRRRAREHTLLDAFTADDWRACLTWWHDACAYCGAAGNLAADHFIPLASTDCPGTVPENMLPACKSCNSSKADRDPVEWLTERTDEAERLEILGRIAAYFDVRTQLSYVALTGVTDSAAPHSALIAGLSEDWQRK